MSVSIKTKEEIVKLRICGKVLAKLLKYLKDNTKAGMSTGEIDRLAHAYIIENKCKPVLLNYQPYGADYPYPATLCISINDEIVHGIPDDTRIIKEGDLVSYDCTIGYDGMITDSAITFAIGSISQAEATLMDITKNALKEGIKAAVPGNYVSDISKAIEKSIPKGYGITKIFSGHGVGYKVHEEPYIPNYNDGVKGPKLKPGMVLAIEPMITLGTDDADFLEDGYTAVTSDGSKAAHFEHTVVITDSIAEVLTVE